MIRNRWDRFNDGEPMSTEELIEMRRDARKTLAFLDEYNMSPAVVYCLRRDIEAIKRIIQNRENRR